MLKRSRKMIPLAVIIGFILLLWRGKDVQAIFLQSLTFCARVLVPAMFPYLVLSRLYVSTAHGPPMWLYRPLCVAFGLSKAGCSAVLIGAVGGYPTGAATIAGLYQKGEISRAEAEKLQFFACNCGPAFCCSVIGIGMYGMLSCGLWLYGITVASSLLCGLLLRHKNENIENHHPMKKDQPLSFLPEMVTAISQSAQSMLYICGYVCLFSLLLMAEKFIFQNRILYTLVAGLTELSGGVFTLGALEMPWALKFSLTAAITAFGGICVAMQSGAFFLPAGLSMGMYIRGKMLQGFLAGVLAWPVSYFLQEAKSAALFPTKFVVLSPWPWCILSILLTFLIFLKIPTGNSNTHPL